MSTPRATLLGELEGEVATIARRARRAVADRARLVAPDLSPTAYLCLVVLRDRAGDCAQQQVADALGLDKGVVSRAVDELEGHGLVRRTPDPADGRRHRLVLTEDARDRLAAVDGQRRARYAERLAGWSTADLARAARLLRAYNDALGDGLGSEG